MNERISELVKKHYCRTEYDNGSVYECYEFSSEELTTFAELLIKECSAYCKLQGMSPSVFTAENLLEHFEIE